MPSGLISVGLASVVNQQQQSGMDLTGAQGQAMFSVGGVQTLANANNAGTASLAVTRSNLSALTTDDYEMTYTGGSWQLTDTTSGQPVAMSGAGTAASPFQAAGLSIVVSGSPTNGDSFLVRPTAAATAGLAVQLTNPSQIAAASLVQSAAGPANTGTGAIASAGITNPSSLGVRTRTRSLSARPRSIRSRTAAAPWWLPARTRAATPIAFDGAQVTLSGAPASGDTFTLSPNASSNTGDNSNVLAMIQALSASVLNGGTTSLTGAANNVVSQVGVVTQQAQANATAQQTVNQSAVDCAQQPLGRQSRRGGREHGAVPAGLSGLRADDPGLEHDVQFPHHRHHQRLTMTNLHHRLSDRRPRADGSARCSASPRLKVSSPPACRSRTRPTTRPAWRRSIS